ncbi:lipase family protein [Corynebacterium sp. P6145]|uniref:lipase family protein n=1 Tax=Corynebacterium antarcticum TaxID=2800405 RepID=UPI002004E238|nr:lipase family protein [Corynebacterium antarcticum]MCK7641372.1 lipase family protein [Corynebacterium antarcticum]
MSSRPVSPHLRMVASVLLCTMLPVTVDVVRSQVARWMSGERADIRYPERRRVPGSVADAAPGTVLSAEPVQVLGAGSRLNPATATAFCYATRDSSGRVIPATGVLLRSRRLTADHAGPRPLIAFAPSTQGVARHCDPSVSCTVGLDLFLRPPVDCIIAYELPVLLALVASGFHVVFIDYPRDEVTGVQYYGDNIAGGQALADAVRAAVELGVSPRAPLGLWGFSQGGGAVGWLVENPGYAPDVIPRAAVVGSPPSDLGAVLGHVDGGLITGALAYAVAGLVVSSDDLRRTLWPLFNDHGRAQIRANTTTCAGGSIVTSAWASTRRWTVSGLSLAELAESLPVVRRALRRQLLGERRPSCPVLLWGSANDDVIPVGQVREVARHWAGAGGDVSYRESMMPRLPGRTTLNHFLPYYLRLPRNIAWLLSALR